MSIFASGSLRIFAVMTVIFIFPSGASVYAQEALRLSLAGDAVAQANRQSAATIGYYNLLVGPTSWRFTSGLGIFYDDNVLLEASNPQDDVYFQPNLTAQMQWPVTDLNTLNFNLGAGYSFYVKNSDLDQVFITPGSGISFDIYAGDFRINLHDQISVTENAYQTPGATNANYIQLQNTAGALAEWNLNKAVATLDYEHANYVPLNSSEQQSEDASENLLGSFGIRFVPQVTVGVEGGGGLFHSPQSSESSTPDATQWSAGAFCSARISEYLTTRLDAGYTMYLPDVPSTNSTDAGGYYFDFSISHDINMFFKYALSAGRNIDLEFSGEPAEHYFVRLQPSWNFIRNYTVSVPFAWEKGTQFGTSATAGSLDFEQFNSGISVSHQFSKKISGVLSYRFVEETSSQASSYTANIIGLTVSYRF
jgi:hypothetical protein